MKRRRFLQRFSAVMAAISLNLLKPSALAIGRSISTRIRKRSHQLPKTDGHYLRTCSYIEDQPEAGYTWASEKAYEDFQDLKFGIRLHWGLYSINHLKDESWSFLKLSGKERAAYQELYKDWNPVGFDADEWMQFFKDSGARMFSFTTKHHDGFSMYDTKTRVKNRVNWTHKDGAVIENCDLAYSIMETPFKRDVVKELVDSAKIYGLKVDLYFSHPDWYDTDFRPYTFHPVQVPGAPTLSVTGKDGVPLMNESKSRFGNGEILITDDPDEETVDRMIGRHRAQLEEIITNYGDIDMVCLDMFLGPTVWPHLRDTLFHLRKIKPNVMFRARGIGNYGDYYTPEGFVPGSKENTDVPWFVIYPLGRSFSYEPEKEQHKGTKWIIHNLVDSVAKGGNFMVGIGPDGNGQFHSEVLLELKETGSWLAINGEGIYGTRARNGDEWKEGEQILFTQSKDGETIFAFCLEWPGDKLIITSISSKVVHEVVLLGYDRSLKWKYGADKKLVIFLSPEINNYFTGHLSSCFVFKISI